MRYTIQISAVAVLLVLASVLATEKRSFAADKPALAAKPAPRKPTTLEKVKCLGAELGKAFHLAVDLFSGNEADLLSKNKTALLSGNSAAILSGNAPKLLSENQTPILSGNSFSMFSNVKIEIHIENSANHMAGGSPPHDGPEPSKKPAP